MMPWCPATAKEQWPQDRLRRVVGSREAYDNWAEAAAQMRPHKADPTWVKQATYLVQAWMNANNLSQADAEKEIRREARAAGTRRRSARRIRACLRRGKERSRSTDAELTETKPEPGVEQAKITGKPAWCDAAKLSDSDRWDAASHRAHRQRPSTASRGRSRAPLHICQRRPTPTWKQGRRQPHPPEVDELDRTSASATPRSLSVRACRWPSAKPSAMRCARRSRSRPRGWPRRTKDLPEAKRTCSAASTTAQLLWIERHKTGTNPGRRVLPANVQAKPG